MNLESRADTGLFRRDLLFRLSTYRIDIPPLRERSDDIPLLCRHFLPNFAITPGALEMLGAYGFPGNVRELRGLLLKAKALSEGNAIAETTVEGLLTHPPKVIVPPREIQAADAVASELPTIHQAIERLVDEALRRAEGRQTTAAKLLGISPQALSKRLKQREKGP
jgi:DNA-binding NtrC family response regulator